MGNKNTINVLLLFVIIMALTGTLFFITNKKETISEPPINHFPLKQELFRVEPMYIEGVKVLHAGYLNSSWEGNPRPENTPRRPSRDCYNITFLVNKKDSIQPSKMWVKGRYTLTLERDKNFSPNYNDSTLVEIGGFNLARDTTYTPPPQAFDGEALVEVWINGKKQYFVVKRFQSMLPQ